MRCKLLPDRRRRRETLREADPAVAAGPLKRIEEPVIGRLDAAVEAGVGGGGKLRLGAGKLGEPSKFGEARHRGQTPLLHQPLHQRAVRRIHLQDADHAGTPSISTVTSAPPSAAERWTAATTCIA